MSRPRRTCRRSAARTARRCLIATTTVLLALAAFAAGADAETVSLTEQGEHAFVVPSGIYELTGITVVGGAGGNGGGTGGGTAGRGAKVTIPAMTVIPGTTLYLEVGADGSHGSVARGGTGVNGSGSGGTATGICDASGCAGNTSVLLMAGGGGGGGSADDGSGENGSGGNGGDAGTASTGAATAGSSGGTAGAGENLIAAAGGGAGRPEHVGGGGANGKLGGFTCGGGESNLSGGSGAGVNGGNGGSTQYDAGNGGGGGGGYDGGGGAGAGAYATCPGTEYTGGGGGGGGGGSYDGTGPDGTIETAAAGATPSLSFEYTPGPSRATTISVDTQEPTVEVGDFFPMTVTATVEDDEGHGVPGDTVSITSSDPDVQIGAVTDDHDGTYSAQIRSSDSAGPVTLTATDSSPVSPISAQTSYVQTAGFPDAVELALTPATAVADGASTSAATATVVDEFGNTVEVGGDSVSFASADPADGIGPVTDHGNGVYTATITASTTAGTPTIRVFDATQGFGDEETLIQAAGPAAGLGLGLTHARVPADGSTTTTAVATLTDAFGNTISGAPIVFSSSDPGQRIEEVRPHGNGTYLVTITASHTAGPATITATDTGTNVRGTTVLTSTPGPPAGLRVGLNPASIAADGTSTTVATVTLTDAYGNVVADSGDAVSITSSRPGEAIGPVIDNHDGTYTARVTASRSPGAATITATDTGRPDLSGTATLTETAPAGSGDHAGGSVQQWIKAISLSQKEVRRGKPIKVELRLATASQVKVYLQRRVPGSGRGKHRVKTHYVNVRRATFRGKAGLNTYELATRYQRRQLRDGTYRVTVVAAGTVRRRNFRITT